MRDNYTSLTSHRTGALKPSVNAKPNHAKQPKAQAFVVPGIGVTFKLDHSLVYREDKPDSIARCRIAYNQNTKEWSMRPTEGSGMLLFFNDWPCPAHTHVAITSVASNQTTCYATTFQAHDYLE